MDFHPHILLRMEQRGVTKAEIIETLNLGWEAEDSKEGTFGKVYVFKYNQEWEGKIYQEKEVTVYYKEREGLKILLTVKARYGDSFIRKKGEE